MSDTEAEPIDVTVGDIREIAKEERDKAQERYRTTTTGTFQNGIALGKYRAYENIVKHILTSSGGGGDAE